MTIELKVTAENGLELLSKVQDLFDTFFKPASSGPPMGWEGAHYAPDGLSADERRHQAATPDLFLPESEK